MFNRKFLEAWQTTIAVDPKRYAEDYKKLLAKVDRSRAIYQGEPVPVLYQGLMHDAATWRYWEAIADMWMRITNKVTQAYLQDASYRALFGFSPEMEALILHDPGYELPVPMARYDMFYTDEERYWFCECNTDGSSAMNEDNVLGELLMQTEGMKDFLAQTGWKAETLDYFDPWVEKSLELYEAVRGEPPKTVAIADFVESGTGMEFLEFQERYEKAGVTCFIPDIRDLKYREGKLWFEDHPIDLVYRRVTTVELVEKRDEAKDFLEAYTDNAFVCIGSMRSQVMHSKRTFSVLHDPRTQALLTDEENAFIAKHIPYTAMLTPENKERVWNEKDSFIIKPVDDRGSRGVYAGADFDRETFGAMLDKALEEPYIVQQFLTPEPMPFVVFNEHGEMEIETFVPLMGMFIYMEQFQGVYTRIGAERVISSRTSYYVAPHILIDDRP